MAHDVFISHSTKDKPTADAVCAVLESNGIRCWIAPRDVRAGQNWGQSIVGAIKGTQVMVLILSAHANYSPQIAREVERAVNRGVTIIPMRIEEVTPSSSLEYFISAAHWLDAFTPPLEEHLQQLAKVILRILGRLPEEEELAPPNDTGQPATVMGASPAKGETGAWVWWSAFLAVAVVGLAGWWFGWQHSSGPTARGEVLSAQNQSTQKTIFPVELQPGENWTNSLGQVFVPVPGTMVLFSIWDTRVQDYRAFASVNVGVDKSWQNPGFTQGDTHPVVNVGWTDAKAFCGWLTQKERGEGKIGPNQSYRLPTDTEWSVAVGLIESQDGIPGDKSSQIKHVYPWGEQWPPPRGAGNYASSLNVDDYEKTSPVGSFRANQYGLYDMGGNVWQWCEDFVLTNEDWRVMRGASWDEKSRDNGNKKYHWGCNLLSSCRAGRSPNYRWNVDGFRLVLEGE